jgi:DNA-binding transcriptional MocR family regulator
LPARFFFVDHTLPAGFKSAQPTHLTDDIRDRSNFFRATFAPPEATIEEALKRFTSTLREFFKA